MTGRAGDIEHENRSAIKSFLIANGKLFVSGEDVGWVLNHDGILSKIDFYENYLHAEYIADDSGFRNVSGIAGDPVGDGLSFGIGSGDGSGNQDFPSEIEPVNGGIPIFEYSPGIEAGVRYEGMGKVVYLAFGLEAANTSAMRDALMSRALDWLNGGSWPDNEQPEVTLLSPNGGECIENGGACEIKWSASDDTGVTSIDILRSYDGGETFPDTMSSGEPNDGTFTWADPDSVCSMSKIRIIARDAAGFAGYDDSDYSFSTGGAVTDASTPSAGAVELFQNIPNPFNPVTLIGFSLPAASHVNVSVYDVAGRCVRILLDRDMPAGRGEVTWNGMDSAGHAAASGIYFSRLVTRERTVSRNLVLLR